jgi:hypothetical protein
VLLHQDGNRPHKPQNNGCALTLLLILQDLSPSKISIIDVLKQLTDAVKFEHYKQDEQHLEFPADGFDNFYLHLRSLDTNLQ